MAPEVLKGEIYTIKADIWSLGVVVYEMAFGFCPYEESSIARLINVLENQELVINHEINPISQQLESLLKKCLVKDHFKRISWDELLNLPMRPQRSDSNRQNTSHQRALSEYNRTNKRESDLTADKGRRA
jgi:serine/threonine protein kinase